MKHKLVKNKNTNNHLIKLLMITISLIVFTALPVMAQPKGRFIYSISLLIKVGLKFKESQNLDRDITYLQVPEDMCLLNIVQDIPYIHGMSNVLLSIVGRT